MIFCGRAYMKEVEAVLRERYLMAYYFKAGRRVSVGPLAGFVDLQRPAKYQSMTALGFRKWRNGKIYAE